MRITHMLPLFLIALTLTGCYSTTARELYYRKAGFSEYRAYVQSASIDELCEIHTTWCTEQLVHIANEEFVSRNMNPISTCREAH